MAPWCGPISTLLGPGENPEGEALGRSQGGFSTKVHLRADGGGKLITLVLTPGQRHEAPVSQLMAQGSVKGAKGRPRLRPQRVVRDKGYSSRAIRRYARQHGIRITIPRKRSERRKGPFDREVYKQRNLVEPLAISSSRLSSRPTMRSSSAILACSPLLCSLAWKSCGAFSKNSSFHLKTIPDPPFRQRPLPIRIRRSWLGVLSIDDLCNVDEEWWREGPVVRMYYRVSTEDGRHITIFRDLVDGAW
jgi:transposase